MRKTRALASIASGDCTIIGTGSRTTMELATFINGAAIRQLDMNDTYMGTGDPGHPSDMLAPCLAVAEALHASGQAFIAAAALAYEVNCRLLDASRLVADGWDYTLQTLPATALAVGRLLGLDENQLTQAVNMALIAHIPTFQSRVQTLSDWKGLANAQATRDAVFAALLAQQGITGPAPIFEGTHGMFRQLGGEYQVDVESFGRRGKAFLINQTSIKPYASEWFALTAIKAAIDLAYAIGDLEAIQEIHVDTTARGFKFLGAEPEKWNPRTRDAADHSMPFIVARAMLDRTITMDSYSAAAINDARLQSLMAKVRVREAPELTAMFPAKTPNRLLVRLKDGRKLDKQVDDLAGFAGRMMSRSDLEDKFRGNVEQNWSKDQTLRALDLMWRLETLKDVSELFSAFVLKSK